MTAAATIPTTAHSLPSPSNGSGRFSTSLNVELAKCLQLVVPASMTADDRAAWIMAAVDALEDIRADEVAAVSAELRRSVTRHNQIVPEIAKLVAERRKRMSTIRALPAKPRDEPKPLPPVPPLSAVEIEKLSPDLRLMGLKCGALEWRGGHLIDVAGDHRG